ncbi:MAG: D-alanyl-D-alanine carboxypeptidase/D-alanyl-D-alanine-endopeptidase [Proteobacteria bacterium]|nr:D-alanyl-D-alanine carboxypeptidase/D-alanyl-D-alanine-endopeptidase [Pseudomonadota bacterium]
MSKYIRTCILFALLVCCMRADGQTIDNVLHKTGIRKENIGIEIYNLVDKKSIYSLNSNKLFSIASVNKLFVTAAALKYLGQDYRFKTVIYSDLPDASGIIKGNIYIKGGGDPLFVSENMWFLVNKLIDIGIKNIKGDIILDDTSFPPADVYEDNGDSDRAYSAKLSALSVNFNSVAVSTTSGKVPHVALDPQTSSLQLVDKTRSSSNGTSIEMRREGNKIIVSGTLNNSNYENKIIYRNIENPSEYFAEVLKIHLKWRGIEHEGSIIRGKADTNRTKLFEIESRRLNDILAEMNKFSNNYIAEQVMRAIADKKFGKASDVNKAIELISDYLKEIGLDKDGFEIINGSGFSRMNRIKPVEMIKFLDYAYRNFSISPEFMNSLSIAGIDGTIRRTHKTDFLTGNLRAKTGTLTGVRSLAGYLNYKDKVYAFIIAANDPNAYFLMNWEGKILEDTIKGLQGE